MTQEEILDYNKLCAEFLNLHRDKEVAIYNLNAYQYDFLKFHSDWNWIMEAVEAIEKLEDTNFYMEWFWLNGTNIALYQRHKQNGSNLWEFIARFSNTKTKKEAVVQAINQFLIWYNENN